MRRSFLLGCALVTWLALSQQASASVIISLAEVGGNVTATLDGDIDLNALQGLIGTSDGFDSIRSSTGQISFTLQNGPYYGLDVSAYVPFGTGAIVRWTSSSGDAFHMFTGGALGLPNGYTSGTALNATATLTGQTFASYGITPGTYTNTFTNGNFTTSVTITTNAVPLPAAAWLFGSAILGLGMVKRKKA